MPFLGISRQGLQYFVVYEGHVMFVKTTVEATPQNSYGNTVRQVSLGALGRLEGISRHPIPFAKYRLNKLKKL